MKTCFPKCLLMSAIAFLIVVHTGSAQELGSCKIAYSYDAAGNRIKREFRCDVPPDPRIETEQPDNTVITSVDPNPTQGPVVGYFSKPVSSAMLELYDINGICLNRQSIDRPTSLFQLDLSAFIPGTYLITLRMGAHVETHPIVKM